MLPNVMLTLQTLAKYFKKIAKVAKFRQTWSHWSEVNIPGGVIVVVVVGVRKSRHVNE